MNLSNWQWNREYSKTRSRLDLLRSENEDLEELVELRGRYVGAIGYEEKICGDLWRELRFFRVGEGKGGGGGGGDGEGWEREVGGLMERAGRGLEFIRGVGGKGGRGGRGVGEGGGGGREGKNVN
jgi:hypothetical protein